MTRTETSGLASSQSVILKMRMLVMGGGDCVCVVLDDCGECGSLEAVVCSVFLMVVMTMVIRCWRTNCAVIEDVCLVL